ncbi:N-alpha-acetyltransferase 80 [Ostrinia nubilalis]|uniref:N-alpha-acetyltransferase 80 n=1 Tax=Ostrinia nubilalis TaxID=29057 RepID=UPI00308261D7
MESENLTVLLLHKHPKYLKPCCDLINDEWPRSETVRMMSLQASCDNLPTSLILVNDAKQLLGHLKLTPIPAISEGCFVETVVISRALRGKKLGSFLMRKAEEYCKQVLKLEKVYLSTKGQENFYAKLGYVICKPVSIYGSGLPYRYKPQPPERKVENPVPRVVNNSPSGVPPPPPPPMPDNNVNNNTINTIKSSKTYMFKYI